MKNLRQKKQYPGLDVIKFVMAVLVAQRHLVQFFYGTDGLWYLLIVQWLSNLAVPMFFTMAGFFLFQKLDLSDPGGPDSRVLWRYVGHILLMYVLWSAIYLPVDLYNWSHEADPHILGSVLSWIRSFLLSSTTVQLWYLPAVAVAAVIVWYLASITRRISWIPMAGLLLFVIGTIGDNWYFNQRLPMALQYVYNVYFQYFMTLRNGIFYGVFFMALGLWFAKHLKQLPLYLCVAGTILSLYLMYLEVTHFYNTNFVFTTVIASFFLFQLASRLRLKPHPFYIKLRGMSEWIYLVHFYFFYILVWISPFIPISFTRVNITLIIWIPLLVFSLGMTIISRRYNIRPLNWLV